MNFDRVVCISLKRRQDRRQRLKKLCRTNGWPFRPIEFFDAVDGGSGEVPPGKGFISGGGAWGCRQSWSRVLEQAMADGLGSILVLEDDAMWRPDFATEVQAFFGDIPADWQIAFLGGQNMATPTRVTDRVARVSNCQRTHAIALRAQGIRFVYQVAATSDRHIDHLLGPACGRNRRAYQATPFLIGQCATKSDISGRKDHARFWTHPGRDYPILWLDASREVARDLVEYGVHYGFDLDSDGVDRGLSIIFPKPGAYKKGINKFLNTVAWESASFEDFPGITTIWHPNANEESWEVARLDLPERVKKSPRFEDTAAALVWLRSQFGAGLIRKRSDRRRLPILLVRSPEAVVEALREAGLCHFGNWRDSETGIDKGLIQLFDSGKGNIADWYRVLEEEARAFSAPVGVWHPKATIELCQTSGREVVVIDATSAGEAYEQVEKAVA